MNDEGILSEVIDWGNVHIGHPAVDLVIVYSFLPQKIERCFMVMLMMKQQSSPSFERSIVLLYCFYTVMI
ncbi:hypothetical protein [Thermaerobacillus caldiproteolyticus]|uniref:hypothetical protein n=1 Tax=Thermaerobacillus caldiproteolyticus TaxID=247480 RepID=UPI00188B7511|nr:hypothetical protein ISX45_17935 [Anoxybacillus caldiproteolyticus]